MESELLKSLIASGPLGIVCGLMFFLYLRADKRLEDAQNKLMDIVRGSIESDNKVANALSASTDSMRTAISLLTNARGGG